MCGYDEALSAELQRKANALREQLEALSGETGWPARQFASDVCRKAFGTALDPESYANLDDEQTRALLPRVEATLASTIVLATVLEHRGR